jgi:hypothetical protein
MPYGIGRQSLLTNIGSCGQGRKGQCCCVLRNVVALRYFNSDIVLTKRIDQSPLGYDRVPEQPSNLTIANYGLGMT